MIDVAATAVHSDMKNPSALAVVSDHTQYSIEPVITIEQGSETSSKMRSQPWDAYDNITISTTKDLTDHHYFLMFPCIPGYALRTTQWSKWRLI